MKNSFKNLLLLTFVFLASESKASNLLDSLKSAYLNNSQLNAERANMRASKEEKRGTISEFLPNITVSGYNSEQDNALKDSTPSNIRPKEHSIIVEQKIFQGGAGVAKYKKNSLGHKLGEFKLKKAEQEILLNAAKIHTELLLNIKKVDINLINLDLLERQVETDQNRLEKGQINLTDLAQSESSLAGAKAQLIAAQNNLVSSKANFEKIVGKKANINFEEEKSVVLSLPNSLASAYKISKAENPDLQIALIEYEQAKLDVAIAGSELSPSASISYKVAEQDHISSTIKQRTQKTVKATASWPLFAGGKNAFNFRKFQELKNQKELLLEDKKKDIETGITNAWSNYQSSLSVLDSINAQVNAAEIASEGITLEYESGKNRTTLEVIQSRSILLNSKINLANAERDFLISQFKILSAVGRLTAKNLNLYPDN